MDKREAVEMAGNGGAENAISRENEEEALVALVEHRAKEVEHNRKRMIFYKSQLQESERKLHASQSKLDHLRRETSKQSSGPAIKDIKERPSVTPNQIIKHSDQSLKYKPEHLVSSAADKRADMSPTTHADNAMNRKRESPHKTYLQVKQTEIQSSRTKRKIERKEHMELIPSVRRNSSPSLIHCNSNTHISSLHKRKLRSLILCPVIDNLFMTSALDGTLNLWQLQARGLGASLLSSTECLSPKNRRWPEDLAWHPEGNSVFAAYSADGGDSQIAVINLNKTQGDRVAFMEQKPHVKGIVNSIIFMPWSDDVFFVSGGSDHAAVLWNAKHGEEIWKPKALHRSLHSSAVMGVAGLHHKRVVISAGADKRIIGFDLTAGRASYQHQIESKCMSVLPNPCDFNLFLVQTGAPEKQLRLFDIRLRQTELHSFGWKQDNSESQSALINQAWSPDGLYITSGSADPKIHIFDIRYNAHKPSQSVEAHQKRVFKAVWHYSTPLLISISSDLTIGMHRIT